MEIDVKYVAKLAKIELTEEQTGKFQKQFENILSYVDKLKEIDTGNVPPLSHAVSLKNVFREDKAKASLEIEETFSNAPQRKGNFFKVPKVIK
ncbi:MAG: Asp-tRNA(Asn)/Glu-tRNA(Gln) amidotransferase subunit GatC [Candidatus Omnitrophota bacterium]